MQEDKFTIKIALAFILGYTPLGILGVWLAYLIYGIVQKYMSKQRYEELENCNLNGEKNGRKICKIKR